MTLHTLPLREPGQRQRLLLRADGTVMPLDKPMSMFQLMELCDVGGFDTVAMTHWEGPLHVLMCDEIGLMRVDLRPINRNATELYWSKCYPDSDPPPIRGDAVLVPDDDFAQEEGADLEGYL